MQVATHAAAILMGNLRMTCEPLMCACYLVAELTVNDESLEGLKFGESAKKSIWRKKVWRISPRILVVYNISYILANKVWRNITIRQIRQTLVPPNFLVVYGILRILG